MRKKHRTSYETQAKWLVMGTLLMLAAATPAAAAVPGTMHFEGALKATGGGPAADGTYQLTFALYDVEKGGTPKWSVGPKAVLLKGGRFAYLLGSSKAITPAIVGTKGLWLELKVGNEPALARQPLGTVPYALTAASVDCTGCIKSAQMKFDADLDLSGYAVKASKLSATQVVGGTVTAQKFIGDGSGLTGIKAGGSSIKAQSCSAGKMVVGIDKDGNFQCASGSAGLPIDGLEQISNGTLSNKFTDIIVSPKSPFPIPDNTPPGIKDVITVPDLGIAQEFSVSLDLTNSNLSKLTVELTDPNGLKYLLFKGGTSGKTLLATYPSPTKPLSGDLTKWKGKNLKGNWTLHVIDSHFLNNLSDGAVNKWSINIQTLSNKKVQTKGKMVVTGDLEVAGKIVVKGQQQADEYPMFPKGSRPFLYGWVEDNMNTSYYSMPFYTYASNVGTSNNQLHDACTEIRWASGTGNIRIQRGGSNGGGTSNRSMQILVAFVKNTTNNNITHKLCTYYSAYGNSHCYASLALNGSNQWNYTSTNVGTRCDNVTFPKNQTSVVVLKTGSRYWTSYSSSYYMRNLIGYYSNTWKLPSGLQWDYKRYHEWVSGQ